MSGGAVSAGLSRPGSCSRDEMLSLRCVEISAFDQRFDQHRGGEADEPLIAGLGGVLKRGTRVVLGRREFSGARPDACTVDEGDTGANE